MRRLLNRLFGQGAVETGDARAEQLAVNQAEADRLIAEGNALEDAGQLAQAETHYRAALKLCPDFARAYLNLVMCKALRG
ncbi:MAG: tetratricopeptide repeat protein [Candidatus Competibacteraceae bacterium]